MPVTHNTCDSFGRQVPLLLWGNRDRLVSRLPACSADYPHPPHPAPARPAPAQYLSLEFCHTQCSQVVVGGVAGRQRCVLPSHCGLTCNGSHPALNVGMPPALPPQASS